MVEISCPDCEADVSIKAVACRRCGSTSVRFVSRTEQRLVTSRWILTRTYILVGIVLTGLVAAVAAHLVEKEPTQIPTTTSALHLLNEKHTVATRRDDALRQLLPGTWHGTLEVPFSEPSSPEAAENALELSMSIESRTTFSEDGSFRERFDWVLWLDNEEEELPLAFSGISAGSWSVENRELHLVFSRDVTRAADVCTREIVNENPELKVLVESAAGTSDSLEIVSLGDDTLRVKEKTPEVGEVTFTLARVRAGADSGVALDAEDQLRTPGDEPRTTPWTDRMLRKRLTGSWKTRAEGRAAELSFRASGGWITGEGTTIYRPSGAVERTMRMAYWAFGRGRGTPITSSHTTKGAWCVVNNKLYETVRSRSTELATSARRGDRELRLPSVRRHVLEPKIGPMELGEFVSSSNRSVIFDRGSVRYFLEPL